jgi:DNA-binding response OmpR family regulator
MTIPMPKDGSPGPAIILFPERKVALIDGSEVILTGTQLRLLQTLMTQPAKVFSRAELMSLTIHTQVSERTVDAHVKDLRHKLGPYAHFLKTARRQGYCWEPDGRALDK